MSSPQAITRGLLAAALALSLAINALADDIWAPSGGASKDIWAKPDSGTSSDTSNNTTNTTVTIGSASAVPTGGNQIELTAHVQSSNPKVNIVAIEYFLDSTNNVTNGSGFALRPAIGDANSSVVTAKATLLISSLTRIHMAYVHACSADQQWSPFVAVVLPPSANDLANGGRSNNRLLNGR